MAKRIFYDGYGNPVTFNVLNPNEVIIATVYQGDKKKEVTVSNIDNFIRMMRFRIDHREQQEKVEFILSVLDCDIWKTEFHEKIKRNRRFRYQKKQSVATAAT